MVAFKMSVLASFYIFLFWLVFKADFQPELKNLLFRNTVLQVGIGISSVMEDGQVWLAMFSLILFVMAFDLTGFWINQYGGSKWSLSNHLSITKLSFNSVIDKLTLNP